MSGKRTRLSPRGFTLVEVLMATVVLVLVFMSSLAAITIGFRMLEDARMSTLASQVLQSEMENLRLKNWSQISTLPASEPFAVETTLSSASFDRFTCTRSISEPRTDLKRITLTLAWTSMDERPHTRSYVTQIGKDGLNDYFYRRF